MLKKSTRKAKIIRRTHLGHLIRLRPFLQLRDKVVRSEALDEEDAEAVDGGLELVVRIIVPSDG